jgi:ribosomal-protein-alanine N-acetyltransferase
MKLFETERLTVRRFTAADADDFFLLNGNAEAMHYIRPPKNRADSDSFLNENLNLYLDGSTLGRFAVYAKISGNFVGTFSFLYLSGEADIHLGYALIPAAWGKGYATELVRTATPWFFAQTGKKEVFAITDAENLPSQRVLLKSGFTRKGQTVENGQTLELFHISADVNDIQGK